MPKYLDRSADIPAPLLKALMSDSYEDSLDSHMESLPLAIREKFDYTISTTTLARSPRQRILFGRHADEITLDPEDRFWAILGRTVHSILEQNHGKDDLVEERLGIVFPLMLPSKGAGPKPIMKRIDIYLHGQADVYDQYQYRIDDWKFTKAEAMLYSKEDHEAQLNVLAYIWKKNNKPVESLRNIYLFRNWESRNVKEGALYPTSRIKVKEIPLWPEARTLEYIKARLTAHFSSTGLKDDELPFCTDAERWQSSPTYRVLKLDENGKPQKMAKHTATSRIEAEDKIEELTEEDWKKVVSKNNELKKPKDESTLKKAAFVIEERKASPRRCSFCEAFPHCNQRQAELLAEAGVQSTEEEDES